jgi:hypothetical protein
MMLRRAAHRHSRVGPISSLTHSTRSRRPLPVRRQNGGPVTQGVLLRSKRASNPDEAKNAVDAFRWWQENHLMEIPEHCG